MAKKNFKNQWYRDDPEQLLELYEMYQSGKYHIYEIAEYFDISRETAQRYIKRYQNRRNGTWKRKIAQNLAK